MAHYISVDAGGSKCAAILFDDDFNLLGSGLAGGVNKSQGASPEHVRRNVSDCLISLFKNCRPDEIAACHAIFIGDTRILEDELKKFTRVLSCVKSDEIAAGLHAGALLSEGIVAISGTGSNVGYIGKDSPRGKGVGGWGPILGDQGSGAWIGQRALREVVKAHDGWGRQTAIRELLKKSWGLERDWYMVNMVYQSETPFRKVASVAKLVGEAAASGDETALDILREAGGLMAVQAVTLINRLEIKNDYPHVICCGGAWKTHAVMFESFGDKLREKFPGIRVEKPWFEHVIAGAARELMRRGVKREEGKKILTEKFNDYVIKW